jgi:hypothetical protein
MPPSASDKGGFRWKLWLLIGCVGWVVLMLAIGTPIGILMTPAFGPIAGWLVGGILYLLAGIVTRR